MIFRLLALVTLLLVLSTSAFAQALDTSDDSAAKPDDRSAQALFEEANGYLGRRYQEFNKKKLPYDPQLEARTNKEQQELALRNAGTLSARNPLTSEDLYYLGMLYHVAADADGALSTMQLLLKDNPGGDKAQAARNVVVLYAIKKGRVAEGVAAVAAYRKHAPQNSDDHYRMEFLIADAYLRAKDYGGVAQHAEGMFTAAVEFADEKKSEPFKRDDMLVKSALLLSDSYERTQRKEKANTRHERRRGLSRSQPSATR